jgi:long-chain acyl-CoA synthetase
VGLAGPDFSGILARTTEDAMPVDTIPARLLQLGAARGNAPAYHVKSGGGWTSTSWAEYASLTRRVGKALMGLGFEPGQKTAILGFNRPEWLLMDVATMAVGGAPAGIYTTCSPPEVAYIISHTEAPVVLVENHSQWAKVKEERDKGNLPAVKHVILMEGAAAVDDDMVLTWDAFLEKAADATDADFDARLENLKADDLATLIYTSGTTGPPKGVMLSHENLSWTADAASPLVGAGPSDCVVSYLPLSHIAEQMFTLHVPITTGVNVYFAESIEKVKDNFVDVQPTILFAVPRIWEKFYAGVNAKLAQSTGVKAKIGAWAMGVGREVNAQRNAGGGEPTGLLGFKYGIASKLVYAKAKPNIGLSRARICVSGAAPISAEIISFFTGLDVQILEVYGQSEDTGPTSFNRPGRTRIGSVGPAFPGVEVKIASDEEILVRGKNVFLGYYKDEAATSEALIDGWLHSGDLGKIDADGFLHITGRKKDIIITAGGKNIAPKNIEASIKDLAVVGNAVVIGDRRKYLVALVGLDVDGAAAWASANGAANDIKELSSNATLIAEVQAHIDEVNKELARVEQIKKFKILERPLEIGRELTPTMKVQRAKVNANFEADIEALYAD